MTQPKTFEELIAIVKAGTAQDIVLSGSPQFQHLLTTGCAVFEAYPHDDQMKAMAMMVGMILGTLHGEQTNVGRMLNVMITHKHRLEMFTTQAQVVFREALLARGITPPDDVQPSTAKKKQATKKAAPVIGIVSGKRRKRVRHP